MYRRRRSIFDILDEYFSRAEMLFERAFGSGWDELSSCIEPLSNIFVGASDVVITIDMPYVDRDSVRIEIRDDVVEVLAKTEKPICLDEMGLRHRMGRFNSYHAVLRVPVPVDKDRMEARLKRGILEIRLPRLA